MAITKEKESLIVSTTFQKQEHLEKLITLVRRDGEITPSAVG